jgi:hypothetical protein
MARMTSIRFTRVEMVTIRCTPALMCAFDDGIDVLAQHIKVEMAVTVDNGRWLHVALPCSARSCIGSFIHMARKYAVRPGKRRAGHQAGLNRLKLPLRFVDTQQVQQLWLHHQG